MVPQNQFSTGLLSTLKNYPTTRWAAHRPATIPGIGRKTAGCLLVDWILFEAAQNWFDHCGYHVH